MQTKVNWEKLLEKWLGPEAANENPEFTTIAEACEWLHAPYSIFRVHDPERAQGTCCMIGDPENEEVSYYFLHFAELPKYVYVFRYGSLPELVAVEKV